MQIDLKTQTGAVENAVFALPFLIAGFSKAAKMAILPMIITVITQPPAAVEVEIITQSPIQP